MVCKNELHLAALLRQTISLLQSIGGAKAFQEEIDYYTSSNLRPKFPTLNHIHIRVCDSIRNTSRMRLVITDPHFESIASNLFSSSLESISSEGLALVTQIIEASCQISEPDQSQKRAWRIFKNGVVDGASYLKEFEGQKKSYEYIDHKVATEDQAWDLALEIDGKIEGVGPALACDFLKEIGVDHYCKPDVWIKSTFSRLRLIGETNQDRQAFGVIWHMSSLTGYSPAVRDKIFWMAASGRWDKTLDKQLEQPARKKQQMWRRQRLSSLGDNFLQGS